MADRMPLPHLHRPVGTSQGLPRFRRPTTAPIRSLPFPDVPNDLWFLAGGPAIFGSLLEPLPASSVGAA